MQVRGIQQAFAVWAQSNKDCYPLPSRLDISNSTVAASGMEKDTTANIMSLLVFNGFISTELLVSPLETNPAIRESDAYEFDGPKTAVIPAQALWDPALSADFTSPKGGNISYAHLLPSGPRLTIWDGATKRYFLPLTAVVGDRGPLTAPMPDGTLAGNSKSNTLRFFGASRVWKGNVAFNDNHVDFLTKPNAGTYLNAVGQPRDDHLFYDEPDDASGTNAFLGIFIKAGPEPKDFKSIWD